MNSTCPFCSIPATDVVWQSSLTLAIRDRFPVSPGHTLVITRVHRATYFDASPEEQAELWRAVAEIKAALDVEFQPAGYNVGFNAHEAAGQTVMHLHVHVIPRYLGDMRDPRGGVRGVIPSKQQYGDLKSTASSKTVSGVGDGSVSYGLNPFATLPTFVPGQERSLSAVLRDALGLAESVDMVVAFVQPGGILEIREDLRQALERGAQVRLLTGDYMNTTSPDALRSLLALRSEFPDKFAPFFFFAGGNENFHAKSYIFVSGLYGVAFVGSSNLSRTALTVGIEWNLRAISSADEPAFQAIRSRFNQLLAAPQVQPLTREIVDEYSTRAPIPPAPEPRAAEVAPHIIQQEALAALRRLRDRGARAGLVVMATGLGKTYLSALDFKQLGGARALFIAHREEILTQARDAWEQIFPDKVLGLLVGDHKHAEADVVFASVQTLSRTRHLKQYSADAFDYIVIDEIHHAAARTYRKVAGHFEPRFLLGLTATPDRMDGQSILDLCHDNLAYAAGLLRGVREKLLVPFRYYGVRDEIDFAQIPWRGRWPVEELTAAVATRERAAQSLREYQRRAPVEERRTLAFCCSVAHADFMAAFFREHGIAAAAVHSGTNSGPRSESVKQLKSGQIEILCVVDVFNEGFDVPDINVVLMLRPTESPVIFLQQLGRGLRRPQLSVKPYLTIVDFIGNHRSFLSKPQALLALVGQETPAGNALRDIRDGRLELPQGCSIEIATDAIDMLEKLARLNNDDLLVYEYSLLRDTHGRRPTAAETYASGVNLRKFIVANYRSWFDFVDAQRDHQDQSDLTDEERALLVRYRDWFADLLKTRMTRSYKMVTLRAMLEGDGIAEPVQLHELARAAWRIMDDDLLLRHEIAEVRAASDPVARFEQVWRDQPLRVWAQGESTSRVWFAFADDVFRFLPEVSAEDVVLFEEMTSELVELRLAECRDRLRSTVSEGVTPIRLRVSHSSGNPILRFDRDRQPGLPESGTETLILCEQGRFFLRFQKIAVNVARAESGEGNALPSLMRSWFGPNAGLPGSNHYVYLSQQDGGWVMKPEVSDDDAPSATILRFPELPFYSDLRVACGALEHSPPGDGQAELLQVRASVDVDAARHFLVRASGDSMSGGGASPVTEGKIFAIADDDLVLCEWMQATALEDVAGSICLLSGTRDGQEQLAALKVPSFQDGRWRLRSTKPGMEDMEIPAGVRLRPVARAIQVVTQVERPVLWGAYDRKAITALFGVKNDRSWQVGHRDIELSGVGHTILFVTLHKAAETPIEHRYADRFLSPQEFQWESQASTKPSDKKARNILEQDANGQSIHLFCRYEKEDAFIYCGLLRYRRHTGSKPIRVWFDLEQSLPEQLWQVWSI